MMCYYTYLGGASQQYYHTNADCRALSNANNILSTNNPPDHWQLCAFCDPEKENTQRNSGEMLSTKLLEMDPQDL